MTLIVAWAALDRKGDEDEVASMYIMSDSRISWEAKYKWDNGRKVFNFQKHPDILGYCGDVLFTTQVISQIITLGDSGLLFNQNDNFETKSESIFRTIVRLFDTFPHAKLFPSFSIIHCGKTLKGKFGCRKFSWDKINGWLVNIITYKEYSDRLVVAGSGGEEFNRLYYKRFMSYERKTSRDIYQCFIDSLASTKDTLCGGPPQLVGVYRGDISKTFGIISGEKRYVLGIEISDVVDFGDFEWRNSLFERCDPLTKKILVGAKRQPKIQ